MDDIASNSFKLIGQSAFAEMKSAGSYFRTGDVLYGRLRPYLNKVHRAKFEGVASAEFIVLPETSGLCGDFLKYLLHQKRFVDFAVERSSGDRPRVKFDAIADFEFMLPPFPEQLRIAEKVDALFTELDKGEEALGEVQKLLSRFRQSVLKAGVTGALTADWRAENKCRDWLPYTLGQLHSLLTSGSRGWAKYYSDAGDIFIRAQNIKNDVLEMERIAFVSLPKSAEGTRTKVLNGDILITITGANVTKTAIAEDIDRDTYVSQHVALFRPVEEVDPRFLHYFLIADAGGRKQLEKAAYGAGKPGLNLQNIKDVALWLPALEEQREVVDRLDRLLASHAAVRLQIERELRASKALRHSILKDAFSGKLVPQDNEDQAPAELLADEVRSVDPTPERKLAKPAMA